MEDWASLVIYVVKNHPEKWETRIWSLSGEDAREKGMATTTVFLTGESYGQRAWQTTVRGVAKSWTQLSDYTAILNGGK